MTALRWIVGLVTTLAALGTAALVIIGGGFRRSFGASDNSATLVALTVVLAGLIIASVVWPERRVLMHIVAVLMIGLCIACVFLARQTVFVATIGVMYAATWLIFYYRTVWQR